MQGKDRTAAKELRVRNTNGIDSKHLELEVTAKHLPLTRILENTWTYFLSILLYMRYRSEVILFRYYLENLRTFWQISHQIINIVIAMK